MSWRAWGKLDEWDISDEGKRGLFIAFAHGEDSSRSHAIDMVLMGREVMAENIGGVLVAFQSAKAAPTDSDAERPTTEWCRVAINDDDTAMVNPKAVDEVGVDFFGRRVAVFWEE